MKPIPLHDLWKRRWQTLQFVAMVAAVSLLIAKPTTIAGAVIALVVVPIVILPLLAFSRWWHVRFGGSRLMWIVFVLIFFAILYGIDEVIELLEPYIGKYFA